MTNMDPLKKALDSTNVPDVTDPAKQDLFSSDPTQQAAEEAPPDIVVDNLKAPKPSGSEL
jgi:hypothetical protein